MISEANIGLEEASSVCKDQTVQFVIPKMEMDIKCFVIEDGGLRVVPSDPQAQNSYGDGRAESTLKLTLKLKPT